MLGASQENGRTDFAALRRAERTALLATMRALGPRARTLCDAWTTTDLAAHLVMSERYGGRPLAAVYPLRKALPGSVRRPVMTGLQRVGERQARVVARRGWAGLLTRLAAGPPKAYDRDSLAPVRLAEEWIHHEDARRANGQRPRRSHRELDEALWMSLHVLTGFSEFAVPRAAIEIALPDGRALRGQQQEPEVRLTGAPGELLLFLAGRGAVAAVTIDGNRATAARLRAGLRV